jgi:hypothetical protein
VRDLGDPVPGAAQIQKALLLWVEKGTLSDTAPLLLLLALIPYLGAG